MRRGTRPRPAFTLLELIVVLSIMALLATLTISAVFRMQESSRESNTNTHLNKIHMEFEKQWSAKVSLIKAEEPPAAIIELTKDQAGNRDMARAKALHMKLRLRQEFPQNFSELNNVVLPPVTPGGPSYVYAVKPAFRTAVPVQFATAPEPIPEQQSAALLILVLSQGSGGSTTNVESIARTKLMDFPQQNGPSIQLRVFTDEWGTHIGFRRWADDDMLDVLAELNQPPFANPGPPGPPGTLLKTDPQDPEGRLQLPQQYWSPPASGTYRAQALALLATPKMQNPFDGRNRGPFIVSAGKNKLFYENGQFERDLDNLYSYRIAGSGRGN